VRQSHTAQQISLTDKYPEALAKTFEELKLWKDMIFVDVPRNASTKRALQ
jgi:hypothetical protein